MVYPSITQPYNIINKHRYAIEYLITNRMDILGICDTSEVDRETYFINNERLIQIGKINTLKCIQYIKK